MKQIFVSFYQKDFLRIKQSHYRDFKEAFVLILFKEAQLLSIILNCPQNSYSKTLSNFALFLNVSKIYPIICWNNQNNDCEIYFSFWLFTLLLAISIILFLLISRLYSMETEENSELESQQIGRKKRIQKITLSRNIQQNHVSFEKLQNSSDRVLTQILSIFLQTFEYITFQPLFYLLLRNISTSITFNNTNYLNIIAITTSICILPIILIYYITLAVHKPSNRFLDKDAMGIFSSKFIYFTLSSNLSLIILQVIQEYYDFQFVAQILAIFYYLILYFQGSSYKYYLNFKLQYILNQITGQIFLILLIFIIDTKQNKISLGLLYIFIAPLLFNITRFIYQKLQRQIIFFHKNQYQNAQTLDWQLRFIYFHCQCIFLKKGENLKRLKTFHSLLLYNLISNHLQVCDGMQKSEKSHKDCFCVQFYPRLEDSAQKATWDKYVKRQLSESEDISKHHTLDMISEKDFRTFIINYINYEYETFLKRRKIQSINVNLSYVYFIIEILKVPTKAFVETLNLYQIHAYDSITNMMLIHQLLTISKAKFIELVSRKQLKNQKYQHQICFQLDESQYIVKNNIFITVSLLRDWYSLLINQKENIESIYNNGSEVLTNIQIIEKQLNQMFLANPLSQEIESFYYFFYKFLNLNMKRKQEFKKNSKIANEFLQSYNRHTFNKDSCVVYITLLNPIGKIIRFTNNFLLFSGIDNKIEGYTNINKFMPDLLARSHDQYLHNFIEKGRMNIVNAESRFLLLKSKNQFVVPVIAKIKLEDSYDDDFGASAIITKVNTPYHYLLLNQYCLLEEISQEMSSIFQSVLNCSNKQLKLIDFASLIPQLISIWQTFLSESKDDQSTQNSNQNIQSQQILDVSLIIPKKHDKIDLLLRRKLKITRKPIKYFQKHEQEVCTYLQQLDDLHLFNLKIKIIPISTIYENVYIIEIQQVKQLKKMGTDEKLERVKQIIKSTFSPDIFQSNEDLCNKNQSGSLKKGNIIEDISNLDQLLILEEDQMGDVLSQNRIKMISGHSNPFRLISQQHDTCNQLLEESDRNNGPQIMAIEIPYIQMIESQKKQAPTKNVFDYTSENQDSSDYLQNQEDQDQIVDKNSFSSSSKYQDQLAKRNLIRLMMFEKTNKTPFLWWYFLYRIGFLGILIQSIIIFILLIISFQNVNFQFLIAKGQFNEMYNKFIIYNQCLAEIDCQNQTKYLLQDFSASLINLTNIADVINFDSCTFTTEKDNIEYEISFLYNIMSDIVQNEEYAENLLVENYLCYQTLFTKIDEGLQLSNDDQAQLYHSNFITAYVTSLISIAIFNLLIIPFEMYQGRKIIVVLRLFSTLNVTQLTNQFQILAQLTEFHDKSNQMQRESAFDILESSKSKLNLLESKYSLQQQKKNVTLQQKTNQLQDPKITKGIINISVKIITLLLMLFMLQSYFTLSYITFLFERQTRDSRSQDIQSFQKFTQSFITISGLLSLFADTKFQGNQSLQQQVIPQIISQKSLTGTSWQTMIKSIAESMDLNDFALLDFCQVFESYSDSVYNYSSCENLGYAQRGFIIVTTRIIDFYNQILSSTNSNLITNSTQWLLSDTFPQIYVDSLFEIQALDILINNLNQLNLNSYTYFEITSFAIYTLLLFIMYFCGILYAQTYIFQSLEQAKMLFSLIPMDALLENSYVMSFALKEQQRLNRF